MYYVASNGVKTAVVLRDPEPMNPRDPDYQDNLTNMVCWHNRLNLGDNHDFKNPYDFAADMVSKHLTQKDVLTAMKNGELSCFCMHWDDKAGEYAVDAEVGLIPGKEDWQRMDWRVSKDMEVLDGDTSFHLTVDVLDFCEPQEMLQMCEKYGDVAIMPLYLYDHSGFSMSTSSFLGRTPHAEWDSGQVGYIYMDKKTAMENLAMESEHLSICQMIPENRQKPITFHKAPHVGFDKVLKENGFTPVIGPHYIKNLYDPKFNEGSNQALIDENQLKMGFVFKKDRTLYALDYQQPNGKFSISFNMKPLAHFNPDLMPLTEENWKSRAEEAMRADVKEYDNYLQGEVYGYEIYEGTVLEDSCWGFNPGSESIEPLMSDELGGYFDSPIEFESNFTDDFDIDEFLSENEFPELKAQIEADVKEFVTFESETSKIYPFAVSAEDILQNANGVLDDIVEEIYDEHEEYDADRIFEAVAQHAGYSREVQPKLTVADLDPNRDYTSDEIMEVMNKKPSLNEMISKASAKRASQQTTKMGKGMDQHR